jgi:hypothetical protein
MTTGSHHLLVFYDANAAVPLAGCSGAEFDSIAYGATSAEARIPYPAGIGAFIAGTQGLRFQAHYINTTSQPLTANVHLDVHLAVPGTVTQHAGTLFISNTTFDVPAGQMQTITKTCRIPRDLTMVTATGHIHNHTIDFQAMAGTQMIYHITDVSQSNTITLNPQVALAAGEVITLSSLIMNDTSMDLHYGPSATRDEMSILAAQVYPVDAANPSVQCQ